jgi:hypothetical protein
MLDRPADPVDAWQFQPGARAENEKYRSSGWYATMARQSDGLFERDTWPWTVARELGFYWSIEEPDKRDLYRLWIEVHRVYWRDDSGPLLAWALTNTSETPRQDIANWGLYKFTDGGFEREVAMLTTPDTGMMKLLAKVVPVVQSLPEDDARWLCGLTGEGWAPTLEELTRLARKLDATSDESLQTSLKAMLEGEIRDRAEADLRAAASTSKQTH